MRRRGSAGRSRLALALTAALGACAATSGCGYSSRRLTDVPGVRTLAVAQFDNDTFRRDVEQRLTRAVAEEVRARTSFRIAAVGSADAVLTGTIRSADAQAVALDHDGDVRVRRFRLVVDARLLDGHDGRVLREWRAVDRVETVEGGFGETLDGTATDIVVRRLAEQVVQGLERPIGSPDRVPLLPASDADRGGRGRIGPVPGR